MESHSCETNSTCGPTDLIQIIIVFLQQLTYGEVFKQLLSTKIKTFKDSLAWFLKIHITILSCLQEE